MGLLEGKAALTKANVQYSEARFPPSPPEERAGVGVFRTFVGAQFPCHRILAAMGGAF